MNDRPITTIEVAIEYLVAGGADPALAAKIVLDFANCYGEARVLGALEAERQRRALIDETLRGVPPAGRA